MVIVFMLLAECCWDKQEEKHRNNTRHGFVILFHVHLPIQDSYHRPVKDGRNGSHRLCRVLSLPAVNCYATAERTRATYKCAGSTMAKSSVSRAGRAFGLDHVESGLLKYRCASPADAPLPDEPNRDPPRDLTDEMRRAYECPHRKPQGWLRSALHQLIHQYPYN